VAQREKTGRGCLVDTALLDSQVGVLANQALNYLASGDVPQRIGNAHPNVVPYQVFAAADGYIIIAVGNDRQFAKLCGVLGEPVLAEAAKYRSNTDRLNNRPDLIAQLAPLIARFARDDLLEKLEAVQVPSGPINMLDQVFANPQVIHRGMRIDPVSAAAKAGTIPGVRTPIMLDGKPTAAARPAPRLGEHTQEILREIGEA
jgi:crotonobetainyl-CoA:carnitine CoA-transferase CaiB-like acyl-CoA transferase